VQEDRTDLTADERRADLPVSPLAQGVIAATAVGAAVVHFAMFPDHYQESTPLGIGFAFAGWFQLALAAAVLVRPSRKVLSAGLAGSLLFVAAWALSRTSGLPLSGQAGQPEDASTVDLITVAFEALTAVACGVSLLGRPAERSSRRLAPVAFGIPVVAVALMTTTALASPESANHTHGGDEAHVAAAGHDDAEGHHDDAAAHGMTPEEHAAMDATEASTDGHAGHEGGAEPVPYDPNLPIDLSGTPGVTPEEQAQAENIIAVTLNGLPQWADPATAEAAGFRSIGDGATGVEHFVHQEFMNDDSMFDPDRPESLVYSTEGGGRRLVAAMYMTKPGTPLDEVPKLGGKLMQWHVHDNLCYNAEGKVRGLTDAEGNCPPGLVKPVETPMIHVWIESHPCGPFAALEGIGGGRIPEGEERLCDTDHGAH
jgi:hypothetical protein